MVNMSHVILILSSDWLVILTGVGDPVAEQVKLRLPDTRAVTCEGGSSLNLTNLSPP